MTTHYEGCYDSGPKHYECALLEVKRLRGDMSKPIPVAWIWDEAKYSETDVRGRCWSPMIGRMHPMNPQMTRNIVPLYTKLKEKNT